MVAIAANPNTARLLGAPKIYAWQKKFMQVLNFSS